MRVPPVKGKQVKKGKIQLTSKTVLQETTNTKVIAAPQNNEVYHNFALIWVFLLFY